MKLRNKETGEIGVPRVNYQELYVDTENGYTYNYKSLQNMYDEWEDYEEPKEYWYIEPNGVIERIDEWDCCTENDREVMRLIGNYFETKEEAEKAVEKLKAWKRLKDMGFTIEGIRYRNNKSYIEWSISQKVRDDHFMSEAFNDALHLLFGGEE